MSIVLPALAVAFSAFWIWLAVRVVNRRERWANPLVVALGLLNIALIVCAVIALLR